MSDCLCYLNGEPQVATLCQTFDNAEVDKYTKIGGPKFATILSLAYRQAYSSTKLTWNTEKKIHWQFVSDARTAAGRMSLTQLQLELVVWSSAVCHVLLCGRIDG